MSLATLRILPSDRRYADIPARRLELDCEHATTGVSMFAGHLGVFRSDEEAAQFALVTHHAQEGCRCTRHLWREYFGCPWPEIPYVTGAA